MLWRLVCTYMCIFTKFRSSTVIGRRYITFSMALKHQKLQHLLWEIVNIFPQKQLCEGFSFLWFGSCGSIHNSYIVIWSLSFLNRYDASFQKKYSFVTTRDMNELWFRVLFRTHYIYTRRTNSIQIQYKRTPKHGISLTYFRMHMVGGWSRIALSPVPTPPAKTLSFAELLSCKKHPNSLLNYIPVKSTLTHSNWNWNSTLQYPTSRMSS